MTLGGSKEEGAKQRNEANSNQFMAHQVSSSDFGCQTQQALHYETGSPPRVHVS